MQRAQVSTEYLLIIGFSMLMVMPLLWIFFTYQADLQQNVNNNQALQIGRQVAEAAETVYFLGGNSYLNLQVYVPEGLSSVNIGQREITFTFDTSSGPSDVVVDSSVNLSGQILSRPGIQYIKVEAHSSGVNVSST